MNLGIVYFIFQKKKKTGDVIENECKIGNTLYSSKRIKSMQTANPNTLYAYKELNTIYRYEWETFFHNTFNVFKITGEWYELSRSQVDSIYAKYLPMMCEMPPSFIKCRKIQLNPIDKMCWRCGKCKTIFNSEKKYKRHCERVVPCDYKCMYCGNIYGRGTYHRHVKNCWGNTCQSINNTVNSDSSLH